MGLIAYNKIVLLKELTRYTASTEENTKLKSHKLEFNFM